MQTVAAPTRVAVSSSTTNELEKQSHYFIVRSQGDEAQPDNSLDTHNKEQTKEDVNTLISDDPDKALDPQLSRQAVNIESSGFSISGVTANSGSLNSLIKLWFVKPALAETFSHVEEPVPKGQKRNLRIRCSSIKVDAEL